MWSRIKEKKVKEENEEKEKTSIYVHFSVLSL
jgi:hypothetical protein